MRLIAVNLILIMADALIKDQEENYEQAIFQCTHHQFIANALAIKVGREILPNARFGGMIATFYNLSCNL